MTLRAILFSFLGLLLSCSSKDSRGQEKNCIELNNHAVDSLLEYNQGRKDSVLLISSLELLNKAIQCDSSYQLAYSNKLTVLMLLKRHADAIAIVRKLEATLPEDPSISTSKGLLYDALNKSDSAQFWYDYAWKLCNQKLRTYPDSGKFIYDRAILIAITAGRDSAVNDINKYVARYPHKEELKRFRDVIKAFDKEKILGH